ncbi:MAG: shikimate kinase [Bacteroidota bacterium]|nr:shikimate kinase [Bacteroidota bacterium]
MEETNLYLKPVRIFLVGFMGSGKTHWGKIWAAATGLNFFDLDEVIEAETQQTISELFEKQGEAAFRELEKSQLREFAQKKDFVLACGGGTPCYGDNLEWMKSVGTVLYLKASPEVIIRQLRGERQKRPLIREVRQEELATFIGHKLAEREPYYSKADRTLDVSTLKRGTLAGFLPPAK